MLQNLFVTILVFTLVGIVWAQRDADLDDMMSGDSNSVAQNKSSFYGVSDNKRASANSYASSESNVAPADVDSKINLIEKQITILTNCYNKMRSAMQSMARKMPSKTATSVAAASLDDNKEILVVLNTLSDKMKQVEREIIKLSSQAASTSVSREDNKEVLMVLDTLSNRVAGLENSMEKLTSREASASAPRENNRETLMAMDTMSERITKVESSLARISAQIDNMDKQLSDSKTTGASVAPSTANDSEAALLSKEILIVVKAMSQKLDTMEMAASTSVSSQGMEDKISAMESAVHQLSLQITSLASQKPQEIQTLPSQQPVMDKISNIENALESLSRQVTTLAAQKPQEIPLSPSQQPVMDKISTMESAMHQLSLQVASLASQKETASSAQNISSNTAATNQESMMLFKTMSEKLDKLETMLASGAPASSPAISEDMLISVVGAVVSPGKIKVDSTGKKDLLEAISEVGGFVSTADRTAVTVRRGPKVFTIDVERIMSENLLSFMLEGKDIVVVKEKEKEDKKSIPPQVSAPAQLPEPPPSPRIESSPTAQSLPKLKAQPKLVPQTGDIVPRGDDGKESVLQREVTALRFE